MEFDERLLSAGRLYVCLLCRALVLICRSCDRGNIYCFGGCSEIRRREVHRRASKLYQKTFPGRVKHAASQARHRSKKAKAAQEQGSRNQAGQKHQEPVSDIAEPETLQPIKQVVLEKVTDAGSQNQHGYGSLVSETTEPVASQTALREEAGSESEREEQDVLQPVKNSTRTRYIGQETRTIKHLHNG